MKEKEKKIYQLEVNGGQLILSVKQKGIDGRVHSASCPNVMYYTIENEKGDKVVKKYSRKQLEKQLWELVAPYYVK